MNLAARLCSQAGPGQILASREVTHLARTIEGVAYVDGGELSLKGLAEPVRAIRVVPEGEDPADRFEALRSKAVPASATARSGGRFAGRRLLVGALVALVALAAIGIPTVVHRLDHGLPGIDANAAGIIDPANGHITGQVALGDIPSGIASGAGAVWVALPASNEVARIDPQTDAVVDRIPVGSNPTAIVFGDGAIWVTNSDSRNVSRIDPAANKSVKTIPVGNAPDAIAFGAGVVWVANALDGTVSKIDPATDTVEDTIAAGASPAGIAVTAGSVWVANGASGTVVPIDASTDDVGQPIPVGHGPSGIVFDGRSLWVANSQSGTVWGIDPAAGNPKAFVPIGGFPGQLAVGAGGVWTADAGANTVAEIDPAAGVVTKTIRVANAPQALAFAGGMLWVTARGSAASHQGGTLTAVTSQALTSIDPNEAYDSLSYDVMSQTYDGLLTYARVGGAAGSAIVPDLAATIPTPTNEGKTYTFSLRHGIRYSDGSPMRLEDVRSSFERVFTIGSDLSPYLLPLVGADACSTAGCSLKDAIVLNHGAWTVTFQLEDRDPAFLSALALPGLAVVPSSAPKQAAATDPLPGTGPYAIASSPTDERLVLERNTSFRPWSPVAQPAGYADRIVFEFGVDIEQATTAVEDGRADVLLDTPPEDKLQEIATRFSAQSHPYTNIAVSYLFMNTNVKPFDDPLVRRALNYAVDRARMADLLVEPGFGRGRLVTCQPLPPNIPGYSPYCPYTKDPSSDGAWQGQDMEKAQRLVADSGTRNTRVTVVSGPVLAPEAKYVAGVLTELHYRATWKVIQDVDTYFAMIGDPNSKVQIGGAGWLFDFPAPSNIAQVLTCGARENYAHFCDRTLTRRIRLAGTIQTADPARANALWTTIDRQVVDAAPWVPFTNPEGAYLVSAKVGDYQYNPVLDVLIGQLWVN